tara:strand:- start:901 stop:1338 length:438 start_codon:yes stop_codon:yes gene_type:complete
MAKFGRGMNDVKKIAEKATAEVKKRADDVDRAAKDFENARQGAITKTGMDAGFKNPFKKKEDPFERSLENFTPGQKETTNPLFFRGQRARDMTYTTGMKKFKAATGQMGGKRKKRKTRKKRKMRKRKTRKQRKMKKRKTRRKRRR